MLRLRSWLIRGFILTILLAGGAAAWVAHDWVSPDRVREALITALENQFPDTEVHVGSASLRLFGGITASEVRLTRRGETVPFFEAPAAIISHDKEQLSHGQLVIRKVELDSPIFRLNRRSDGTWNVEGLTKSSVPEKVLPTFVVRNATVFITDLQADGLPPLALQGVKITLLNDPLTILKIETQFTLAPGATSAAPLEGGLTIPVNLTAKFNRVTNAIHARIEVPDLGLNSDLAPVVARLHPELAEYTQMFSARASVRADISKEPTHPMRYDIRVELREGKVTHSDLPWPVEQLAAAIRVQDGKITVEKGTARFGKASIEFALESGAQCDPLAVTAQYGPRLTATNSGSFAAHCLLSRSLRKDHALHTVNSFQELEEKIDRLEITVRELALDDELFSRIPQRGVKIANRFREMFNPTGTTDLSLKFQRTGSRWERTFEVRPNKLAIAYEKLRYPVQDLSGWVRKVTTSEGTDEFRVQLTGTAGGRRVEANGRVMGEGPDPLIELRIAGTDIPIDDRIFSAFPKPYPEVLGKLRSTARGDFVAEIRQPLGVNRCENTIRVRVYDGNVNYVHFPYPLSQVRGHVMVSIVGVDSARPLRPGLPLEPEVDCDRVEIREFEGEHAGGKIWVPTGASEPVSGSRHRKLALRVLGENCPIDADMKNAMVALKLDGAWRTFAPRGRLTFGADVEILDRAVDPVIPPAGGNGVTPIAAALPGDQAFDPSTDLKLTLNFKGPTITPSFFHYEMDNLAGVLRYQGGKVDLAKFSAHHKQSKIGLEAAEVRFSKEGEIWANLGGLRLQPLVLDQDLLKAMPGKIRSGLEELKLQGLLDVHVRHLVVKTPQDGTKGNLAPPTAGRSVPVARGQIAPEPVSLAKTDPDPIVYWNAEVKLVGASLDTGLSWTDVNGTLASVGVYEGTHLGSVLGNAWIERAAIAKQPISSAKMSFRMRAQEPDPQKPGEYTPPALEFPDLIGTLYQGTVGGEARVVLSNPIQYRLWLTASGVRLDEMARHLHLGDGAELRGLAQGKLLVENLPDPKTGLLVPTGAGQIDVPNGRMYNLPILLPLLKLLKLQAPDQTAFEEAHAMFDLRGERIHVSQLDLIGTAVSLGGSGELSTNGEEVRFEFYTIWSQALKRWLTTPLGDVTSLLSGSLFKIEMIKQRNGEMTYHPHMLPVITDPVRSVAERVRNRMGLSENAPVGTFRAMGPR